MANLGDADAIFSSLTGVFGTVSPLGRRTNARERIPFRFSQELPRRQVFRREMRPQKRLPVVTDVYVRAKSHLVENTHQFTKMPPSLHIPAAIRPEKERSPKIVHGTLYQTQTFATGTGGQICGPSRQA
jgi:hypothetical protein